jgi:hypothetical protein
MDVNVGLNPEKPYLCILSIQRLGILTRVCSAPCAEGWRRGFILHNEWLIGTEADVQEDIAQ